MIEELSLPIMPQLASKNFNHKNACDVPTKESDAGV
jgi:hypothetical protein